MVNDVIAKLKFDTAFEPETVAMLQSMAAANVSAERDRGVVEPDPSESWQRITRSVETLAKVSGAERGGKPVPNERVVEALKGICPLWPFC